MVLLVIAFALDFARRRRQLERVGHAPKLLEMAASVSPGWRVVKVALLVLGTTLLAVTAARPQTRGDAIWRERGIDVVLAIDVSKSMLVQDVYPNRIRQAKLIADNLLTELGGHQVGIVAFGGGAAHFPLTSDHEAARLLYHGLSPGDLPAGTSVGTAVLSARCLLLPTLANDPDCRRVRGGGPGGETTGHEKEEAHGRQLEVTDLGDRARAIVLLTDAEETEGDARAEIAKAAKQGIHVFVVGIGTPAGGTIPETDEHGRMMANPAEEKHTSRLEEGALKELAQAAGGEDHYFRADPRKLRLESLENALKKLKEGEREERTVNVPIEIFQISLYVAFLLLLWEACVSDRRRKS
jgi:Ca-activated chloride channel family protein